MGSPTLVERSRSAVDIWRTFVERRPIVVRVAAFLGTTMLVAVTSWPRQPTDLPGRTVLALSPIGGAAVVFVIWRDAQRRKGKGWKIDKWIFGVERIGSGSFEYRE